MSTDKKTTDEMPPGVSAAEFVQALVEALEQRAATRGETSAAAARGETNIVAAGSNADRAIRQYADISADLETLPLQR